MSGVLVTSFALCAVFYGQFVSAVQAGVRERVEFFKDGSSVAAIAAFPSVYSMGYSMGYSTGRSVDMNDLRVSVIDPDGTVEYDNTVQAESLPNHLDRKEVQVALESGVGEIKRFSSTLREETYYYAVRLSDGKILRAAKTTRSAFSMFGGALPVVVCAALAIVVAGNVVAGKLTNRIVEPINEVQVDTVLTPPYEELSPFVRAITAQRGRIIEQLEDLQRKTDTIDAIMDNMREGVVLVDGRGIILSANKSVLRIFGAETAKESAPKSMAPKSMEGKNILELLRDIDLLKNMRNALSGRSGEMDLERSGQTYRVYFSSVSHSGAIILFLNTTERAKAEKIRREFSANVSHELKTPLTSISGYAEMLVNGMAKEEDRSSFAEKIKDEATRLIALVEDIMMISEMVEGRSLETIEDVNLAAVAGEAVDALALKAEENEISVTIDVPVAGKEAVLKANRAMIYEMFYNLIDNAVKYNKPGGAVKVSVGRDERDDGRVTVSVSDTGIGIPEEAQARVFERFYRVDKSRSRKTGGTGLGLAIVKHIALACNAKVVLTSRLGEGTTVTVNFGV
ncbi:MAG: PAS domain-containing protein [Synergistaceae bacterium]|nr:PAS domain-containing protein [Synergistaceae bacterium]